MAEDRGSTTRFADFALSPETLRALDGLGFTTPTPIQARALPPALEGRDVLGKAQTGTGKTLAFGLPLVERLDPTRVSAQSLVLLPTRELAQQVAEHLETVAAARGLKVALLVGGEKVRFQRARIPGRQIVVGTPGRILDLLRERLLHLEWAEVLVLDEFDRMLDMGFIDDVKRILAFLPAERQTMLFSATVPQEIRRLANGLLRDPVEIEVEAGLKTAVGVQQFALRVSPRDRLEVLFRILEDDLRPGSDQTVLIFCNTRVLVAELDRELWGRGLPAAAISGDFEQSRRFQVIDGFREKRIRILVATDVASRGLDIDHVGHVINFDVPLEPEDYVHRIGRTARAGRTGKVTTLIIPRQESYFRRITGRLGGEIRTGAARISEGQRRELGDLSAVGRGSDIRSAAAAFLRGSKSSSRGGGPRGRPRGESRDGASRGGGSRGGAPGARGGGRAGGRSGARGGARDSGRRGSGASGNGRRPPGRGGRR